MNERLTEKLNEVEKLALAPKWKRLLNNPYKYLESILFRKWVYPKSRKEIFRHTSVFFGGEMLVAIPASTDIYLTGGKSHDSEIRLARFLMTTLQEGDSFLDIGAHYGYFSLLAATLVGSKGVVRSYEPSNAAYGILEKNSLKNRLKNVTPMKNAVSDNNEEITFYEFPNLYSEYNSMNTQQFENEKWFDKYKPVKVTVAATTIDNLTAENKFHPKVLKIDVEGAEYKVISGGRDFFTSSAPYIIMEYLNASRNNKEHNRATVLLKELGYQPFAITHEGKLQAIDDIETYLTGKGVDSDNIAFKK